MYVLQVVAMNEKLTKCQSVRPVVLPDSLAAKAGLTKDHARIRDENGGGYGVFVEGLHQLHCLVIRRFRTHRVKC